MRSSGVAPPSGLGDEMVSVFPGEPLDQAAAPVLLAVPVCRYGLSVTQLPLSGSMKKMSHTSVALTKSLE